MESVTKVICDNESLIYSIASKFSKYKNKEDLFQAGYIGIIEAYNNFDETKGVKFTTYAYQYIYGEISKYVREDHTIKTNRELYKLKNKIEKARSCLEQKLMHEVSNIELSKYLEMDLDVVDNVLNYCDPYSMDEIINGDLSLHEVIGDNHYDYDINIALKMEIDNLNEPEKTIIISRYFEDLTQSEVAKNIGLSQVDVSRKERKVLQKLKKTFN